MPREKLRLFVENGDWHEQSQQEQGESDLNSFRIRIYVDKKILFL